MYGAILGDIVGSRFEFHNIKSKDFELCSDLCFLTDDSVLTLAIAKAILDSKKDYSNLSEKTIDNMKYFGNKYPNCGYGGGFRDWLESKSIEPYNSCGNGSAMRVSSVAWIANSIEECENLSEKVTRVTHNHFEGIKGAEATSVCIFLAKTKHSKEFIKDYIINNYYDLNQSVEYLTKNKKYFDAICQETVPQAITCFLESENFEDCIRNAISIGGDSDTLAAIAGSIAEAYYGFPEKYINFVMEHLPEDLKQILIDFNKFIEN